MAFIEAEFPKTIGFKAMGGPGFNTTVNSGFSGFEQRNQNWQIARGQWTINLNTPGSVSAPNVGQQEYIDMLTAFFLNVGGKANAFRLKDHKDYTNGSSVQAIGNCDGLTSNFQLIKQYTSIGKTYTRTISKPMTSLVVDYLGNALLDTVQVSVGGAVVPKIAGYLGGGSTAKYSLDETTGVVSFGGNTLLTLTGYTAVNGQLTQYFYTIVSGPAPQKNQQFILTNSLYSAGIGGIQNITSVTALTATTGYFYGSNIYTHGNVTQTGLTQAMYSGVWGYAPMISAATSGGNTTYTYYTGSSGSNVQQGLTPQVGQRVTIKGFTNAANNGSFYVTAIGTGTFTVVNTGVNETISVGYGVCMSDWTPASGAGLITATFQYHMPVRLDTDELMIQLEESNVEGGQPIVSWNSINLKEVRILPGQSQG
jgi:uncharacterized protein (TIGR02217 family)